MARNKQELDVEQHTTEDAPESENANNAFNQQMTNNLVLQQKYELAPYNRQRVISEAKFYIHHAVESYLELGKRLIQMKENEPHGEWLNCLQAIGMNYRVAHRTIQATLKMSNVSSPTHFAEKIGNKTKMFELLVFDDEEIKELSEGKSVAGLKLDDVECMSASELRAAIRKARKDAKEEEEAMDKVIAQKDKKLNELAVELEKLRAKKQAEPEPAPVFKPVGTDELEALQKLTRQINADIGAGLHKAINDLFNAFGGLEETPRNMQLAAAQSVGLLITTLNSVADYFYITPETDTARATQDPLKADIAEFEAWMEAGQPELLPDEVAAFNERMGINQPIEPVVDAEWKPIDKPISEWTNEDWTEYEQHGQAHDIKEHLQQQDDEE